ncbi:MAG: hypothetical protein E2O71_02070 [Deltaproteobacteria bacterium]|nr:MAG: hypothetical protein E2O71_02070 [Deltaproteobacteria bacterium]
MTTIQHTETAEYQRDLEERVYGLIRDNSGSTLTYEDLCEATDADRQDIVIVTASLMAAGKIRWVTNSPEEIDQAKEEDRP